MLNQNILCSAFLTLINTIVINLTEKLQTASELTLNWLVKIENLIILYLSSPDQIRFIEKKKQMFMFIIFNIKIFFLYIYFFY